MALDLLRKLIACCAGDGGLWCQVEVVRSKSMEAGAFAAVLSDHWAKGERTTDPQHSSIYRHY